MDVYIVASRSDQSRGTGSENDPYSTNPPPTLAGVAIVTADHGNAEEMIAADGSPQTAHTTNPVPVIVTRNGITLRSDGVLSDLSPTILALLGVPEPAEMTGVSLIFAEI